MKGRRIGIHGSEGVLVGGTSEELSRAGILVTNHLTGETQHFPYEVVEGGYAGRGEGDMAMTERFYREMTVERDEMLTSIQQSVEGHRIAFAAEEARVNEKRVGLETFSARRKLR